MQVARRTCEIYIYRHFVPFVHYYEAQRHKSPGCWKWKYIAHKWTAFCKLKSLVQSRNQNKKKKTEKGNVDTVVPED